MCAQPYTPPTHLQAVASRILRTQSNRYGQRLAHARGLNHDDVQGLPASPAQRPPPPGQPGQLQRL